MPVDFKPPGHHTVTPYLILKDAASLIEFYKKAFGAEELFRKAMPDGKVMHARLKIGDSPFMVSDEFPNSPCGASPATVGNTTALLHIYVPDVDAAFDKAVKAGAAAVVMPPTDMFWGERYCQLKDPSGHLWSLSTVKEILTPEQQDERMKKQFANMGKSCS
jgi:PhnB protein